MAFTEKYVFALRNHTTTNLILLPPRTLSRYWQVEIEDERQLSIIMLMPYRASVRSMQKGQSYTKLPNGSLHYYSIGTTFEPVEGLHEAQLVDPVLFSLDPRKEKEQQTNCSQFGKCMLGHTTPAANLGSYYGSKWAIVQIDAGTK